jgi:CRP-like cAMP-binding protein
MRELDADSVAPETGGRKILERKGWLATRSEDARELLLSCGRERSYSPGEALYRYGDSAQGMFGLISGQVLVSVPSDAGTEFRIFQGTPGFWVGDLALFTNRMRLVSVTAVKQSRVMFLPGPRLQELVLSHPGLYEDFYALSQANFTIALRLLANLSIPQSGKRLAAWLLMNDEGLGAQGDWIEVSQENAAQICAMSLPTAQRILRRLVANGLIELGYGQIRVIDRDRLWDHCQV